MTMLDSLFGLIPAASTGQQWVARELQLVNWGGYDGHHRVVLAPGATLLSGASGSGKSTLMDAYIALLMPHTTPFNGASNGGVVGRPRGKDQRNVISYARGKIDESRTADGTKQRVLRGDGRDTWSAIAMTWADQSGSLFTAVRAWYVPAGTQAMEDLVAVRATVAGAFDARGLAAPAEQRFARATLTALGLTCYDTDKELTARLHSTLGIGAAGGGAKAVALLARIQAGQQITTVDALYKAMVLEEPETLAKADDVVEHFDELAGTRAQMLTAQQQVRVLAPIRQHRAAVDAARARLAVIAGIGTLDDVASPVSLWRHRRRVELLRGVEDDVRRRARAAAAQVAELTAAVGARKDELDGTRSTLWASGGAALQNAQRELVSAQAHLDAARRDRGKLDAALAQLDHEPVTSRTGLEKAVTALRARLADGAARHALFAARDAARDLVKDAERAVRSLESERAALAARQGNVPEHLHAARVALAKAAGLRVEDLPFVAELVEVRTEHETWREAFNLALGAFATTVLVDEERLEAFRAAIEAVPTRDRIRFEGVPTGFDGDVSLDPGTLAGRLDVRPGPFHGWLRTRLAERFAYVCVDSAAHLARHGKALTRSGQTSEGARGAHGGQGRANVLGFTNSRRLAHLDEQVAAARRALVTASEALRGADLRLDAHEEDVAAARVVLDLGWDQVDVDAAQAEVDRWSDVIEKVKADNADLGTLEGRARELDTLVGMLQQDLGSAKSAAAALDREWEQVSDAVDVAQRALDDADEQGGAVTDEQRAYLDGLVADVPADAPAGDPEAALRASDDVVARVADRLRHDTETAELEAATGTDALRATFEAFLRQWEDPNLGTDPDASYPDFERVLTTLETARLHELEADWRKSLLRLSGADLTDFEHTMARAVREITDRIAPVNEILASLPFADDAHRLRIDAHLTQSALVTGFRKELRAVRTLLGEQATDAEREARFARMARLVDRMRRTAPDFADLVDVRRHVRLAAEKVDLDGTHVALYDHIGEKSGGESQELVAFIVGAALRYQLGDAGATRPRYAPVFLDEALIKADAQFSGRAVGAWRGLGFQLVVGAPNDKVSALEPHVEASYVVVKDASGRSRARAVVGLSDEARDVVV